MFSSVWLTSVFTLLFLVTGVYSVVRLAALASGASAALDRAAELSHVLMSVAMIAMTWGWSGGPSSPSGVLQIVAFGLVGLYFLIGAVRGYRAPVAGAYHLVMALAMVWMVATMPLLMGAGDSSATAMDDMPGMSMGGSAPAASATPDAHRWVLPVTLVFVALLVAAAIFWAARAVRSGAGDGDGSLCGCAPEGSASGGAGAGRGVGAGRGAGAERETGAGRETRAERGGGVAVAIAPPKPVRSLLSPHADAVCHVLMSAGMAAMLAAML